MASQPVRVPNEVYEEVQNAARLFDCTPGELFARAWESYRESPEFRDDFHTFQKAFASGDIDVVTQRLRERRTQRAADRSASSRARRGR
ncbi:MAG: hypothetical protein ACT4OX_15650 [Actinomycetota bacterium]